MFAIKVWETEGDRDQGSSEIDSTVQRCYDAIDIAKRLFDDGNCAVEVLSGINSDKLVYHISKNEDGSVHTEDHRSEIVGCGEGQMESEVA